MQALAPPHAVAELEIPVGRHLRCGRERLLARGSDDEFSLNRGSSKDLGSAVTAFEPELPDVERRQRFRLLLSAFRVCHILRQESRTTAICCRVLSSLRHRIAPSGSGGTGRRTSLRGWRSQDRGGSNPPFRTNNLQRFWQSVNCQVVKYVVKLGRAVKRTALGPAPSHQR